MEIIKSAKEENKNINFTHLAKEYNTSDRTIRRIKDDMDNFVTKLENAEILPSFPKMMRFPSENLMESKLHEWFQQKRDVGDPISGNIVKEQAILINEIIGGDPEFKASEGWLARFKSRYGIRSCTIQGERLSSDEHSSIVFKENLETLMQSENLKPYQIYNADETGLFWRSLPHRTFVGHNETGAPGFKKCKDRVTVMVCANGDGSHKIPLLVIGKSKNPRCFKDFDRTMLPVTYIGQSNAWMNTVIFKKWYIEVFLPAVEKEERNEEYRVVLILDNAKCHSTKEELELLDDTCSILFLPPNVTALVQPMDQGIIEKMKRIYRKSLLRELLLQEDEESLVQFLKKRNIKTCCFQIANAWKEITSTNVKNAWGKLFSQGHETHAENHCTESVEAHLQLLSRIPGYGNITNNEVHQWFAEDANDPGWQILSASEITNGEQDICNAKNTLDDFSEEEEEEMLQSNDIQAKDVLPLSVEAVDALKAFEIYRHWFEARWECNTNHCLALQSLHEITKEIVSHVKEMTCSPNNSFLVYNSSLDKWFFS